jgi:ribosomal protein S18 acetylase RimI-like enzyme
VRVEFIDDVDAFAARALPLLVADEASHTVLLSALQGAQRARREGRAAPDPWAGALIVEGAQPLAAARLFRANWMLGVGPESAYTLLGRWANAHGPYAGFAGPESSVRAFAAGSGHQTTVHMDLPLLRLTGTPVQRACAGELRRATGDDLALVAAWTEAFRLEARLHVSAEQAATDVQRALRNGTQYLWLDLSGTPQGLIGGTLIAPSGARIGPVYTPPDRRGRGIGGAMVCALSGHLLASGARCVFLFTDASNPTSNGLYRRIGFEPISRHLHLTVATT